MCGSRDPMRGVYLLFPVILCVAAGSAGGCRVEQSIGTTAPHRVPAPSTDAPETALPWTPPLPTAPTASDVPDVPEPSPPDPCPLVADRAVLDLCALGATAVAEGRPFATIAEALAGSAADVSVCPGLHPGGFQVNARRVSAADPAPDVTVIGPGPADRPLVTVVDGELAGLTLTGGRAPSGAAVTGVGTVTLTCVTAHGNTATLGDGGAVQGDTLLVGWSTFEDNAATGAGGAIDGQRVQVWDTTFTDNRARAGGALSIRGPGDLARVEITRNLASEGGGVSFAPMARATLGIADARFDHNAAESGGGLVLSPWAAADADLWRVAFEGNLGGRGGGGLDLAGSHGLRVRVQDGTFTTNDGGEAGGIGISGWMPAARVDMLLVHFHDNTGTVAGALGASSAAGRVAFHGDRLQVWRNSGNRGAASLGGDDTLDCVDCDFGDGDNDNQPTDASRADGTEESLGAAFQL
jgi:hypothetical protein